MAMVLDIEIERDEEGLWIGTVPGLPQALVYAVTQEQARARVRAMALRLIADRLERGDVAATLAEVAFVEV
jgi:hypothetical protein